MYHAGDRDCHGLKKDEKRQLTNGKTGKLSWELRTDKELPHYVDSDTQPKETAMSRYVPWNIIGKGKERELDAARSCAVWPDATDEQLTSPALEMLLNSRLPALMADFQKVINDLGFTY